MSTVFEVTAALLRLEVGGKPLPVGMQRSYTQEQQQKLLSFSKIHDVAHVVADGLLRSGCRPQTDEALQKTVATAQYRVAAMEAELEQIRSALAQEEIPYIVLKGSVLRRYYPQPWMRTGCDIDVLVCEVDLSRAVAVLCKSLAYRASAKKDHDVSLHSPGGVHLELHYNLQEERLSPQAGAVLSRVWELSRNGEMPPELFYFHHIAHMARHLRIGGCGIRPFLDLWVMDTCGAWDKEACDALLTEGGLLPLAQAARALSRVWFEEAEPTELTRQFHRYITHGGLYGGLKNRITLQHREKSKAGYLWSRIFAPYEVLKELYPNLKSKATAPFYQVHRWCSIVGSGRTKNLSKEIRVNRATTQENETEVAELFKQLGI